MDFESKPVYDNDDKYIKTKKNIQIVYLQTFIIKKCLKKNHYANVCQY